MARSDTNTQVGNESVETQHHVHAVGTPAPPTTSISQQWSDYIACLPDWLLPSSCSGCLGQVVEQRDRNSDGTDVYDTRAQSSSCSSPSLLDNDNDESAARSSDSIRLIPDGDCTDGGLIKSVRIEELKNSEASTSTPKNGNEGIEISQDEDRNIMAISLSAAAPLPRLKNRIGTPRGVYRKRIVDLIEVIQSTPTPSSVRNQVLTFHGQHQYPVAAAARQNESLPEDNASQSLATSDVQVVRPLSFTLTSPILTRPGFSSTSKSYTRHSSLGILVSPQLLATPCEHRRTKSLPTAPASTLHNSSRSLSDDSTYFVAASHRSENVKHDQPHSPALHDKSAACIQGISFANGKEFLAAAIDLDWCCDEISKMGVDAVNISPSTKNKGNEGCGGYVGYCGVYHPCTQDRECQGCIFRLGMHLDNQHECGEEKGETFYDSDPGEHFAIGTISRNRHLCTSEEMATLIGAATFRPRRPILSWTRRRKHKNHHNLGSSASIESSQGSSVCRDNKSEDSIRQQDGQQAHLYDYFSQNHDVFVNTTLQTGICSTNMMDVKKYVQVTNSIIMRFPPFIGLSSNTFVIHTAAMRQDALNSRWRLRWHVKNTTKLCDVWIERAYRYNGTEIVEPKLTWCEISQPNLREQRRLVVHPYRVSLFALRRILQVSNESGLGGILRHSQKGTSVMGLTNPNSLLLIRSSLREDYMFEASCVEERDHIVHLLKMATARLVSHAVEGNGDLMIEEYFHEGY